MWCANQAMIARAARVLRGRAAGDRGLVALAPHRRRQPQFRLRALQRRHAATSTRASRCRARSRPRCANLREVATNWYFTVPKGYEALLPYLARRRAAAKHFLPAAQGALVRGRGAVAIGVRRDAGACARDLRRAHPVPDRPGLDRDRALWRSARMWQSKDSTNMGVPAPGVELKLVPCDGKLEARLRGPNIMPGYWRQRELTAAGLRRGRLLQARRRAQVPGPRRSGRGPAVRRPHRRGLQARHRHLGQCRPVARALLAQLEPYARDVVIAGADCNEIGALIFPHLDACRRLAAARRGRRHRRRRRAR